MPRKEKSYNLEIILFKEGDIYSKKIPSSLYNILQVGIGGKMKKKIGELKDILMQEYKTRLVDADYPLPTEKGFPVNWGGVLSPGWCTAKI